MLFQSGSFSRRLTTATAFLLGAALGPTVFAAGAAAPASDAGAPALPPSALINLINRLAERGVLTKADSNELLLLAEADAAEARAQAAQAQAALAQAAALEARAKAVAAIAALRAASAGSSSALQEHAVAVADETERAVAVATARLRSTPPSDPSSRTGVQDDETPAIPVRPARVTRSEAPTRRPAPSPDDLEPAVESGPAPASVKTRVAAAPAAPVEDAADTPDDTVRVTYVPEVVKQRLREEVKQDVLDEARKEGWATPHAVPDWVTRFRLFGDVRFRYEGLRYPSGNDNTGAFPNFNAINTGAPFDVSGSVFSPQFNVDQDRDRLRLRARLGAAIDLGESFSAGLRLATGENNSPVTQNQSLGAAGSGQGGNFSKYALWLDRGFLKYELGGLPDEDLVLDFGRFDNPFMSTSMLWADDLGFDGLDAHGRMGIGEDVTSFFTLGAFPVFNTDLNFATNQPAKFKSDDKWLYAAQLGATFDLGKDFSVKVGAAYYLFRNIEGRLSPPFTPLTSADAGDTDATRPAFAQKGNTYMALRDIVAGPLNQNGKINQFQYFGLASKFRPIAFDGRLEFNPFEPFQIVLTGEYVKNLAFDPTAIAARAVNNRGAATTSGGQGPYLGGNTAWLAALTFGDAALQKRWDWNLSLGYRKVESDALVDGFCDSDFGGGGTNVKGFTLAGNLALSSRVWLGLRWMSASEVAGPVFKNDIIQMDLNGKF